MATNREIVIKDSCTLIDLIDLGLVFPFFALNLTVYTTPNVLNEVTEEEQARIVNECISKGHLLINGEGKFSEIAEMRNIYPVLSIPDCSVLELASRINASILTSDGSLRKIAIARKLEVHGVLWVIRELCLAGIIPSEMAIEKLKQYPKMNSRCAKPELIDSLIIEIRSNFVLQPKPDSL